MSYFLIQSQQFYSMSFSVEVEHCKDCHFHTWNSRHDEIKYIDFFEQLSHRIVQAFPQSSTTLRLPPPSLIPKKAASSNGAQFINSQTGEATHFPRLGSFEVYVDGQRIFSKLKSKKWPNLNAVISKMKEMQKVKEEGQSLKSFDVDYLEISDAPRITNQMLYDIKSIFRVRKKPQPQNGTLYESGTSLKKRDMHRSLDVSRELETREAQHETVRYFKNPQSSTERESREKGKPRWRDLSKGEKIPPVTFEAYDPQSLYLQELPSRAALNNTNRRRKLILSKIDQKHIVIENESGEKEYYVKQSREPSSIDQSGRNTSGRDTSSRNPRRKLKPISNETDLYEELNYRPDESSAPIIPTVAQHKQESHQNSDNRQNQEDGNQQNNRQKYQKLSEQQNPINQEADEEQSKTKKSQGQAELKPADDAEPEDEIEQQKSEKADEYAEEVDDGETGNFILKEERIEDAQNNKPLNRGVNETSDNKDSFDDKLQQQRSQSVHNNTLDFGPLQQTHMQIAEDDRAADHQSQKQEDKSEEQMAPSDPNDEQRQGTAKQGKDEEEADQEAKDKADQEAQYKADSEVQEKADDAVQEKSGERQELDASEVERNAITAGQLKSEKQGLADRQLKTGQNQIENQQAEQRDQGTAQHNKQDSVKEEKEQQMEQNNQNTDKYDVTHEERPVTPELQIRRWEARLRQTTFELVAQEETKQPSEEIAQQPERNEDNEKSEKSEKQEKQNKEMEKAEKAEKAETVLKESEGEERELEWEATFGEGGYELRQISGL